MADLIYHFGDFRLAPNARKLTRNGKPNLAPARASYRSVERENRRDQAITQLKEAMIKADTLGVPELIGDVGYAYAQALLAAGKLDSATSISGRISTWAEKDWRAAWTQVCAYRALGQDAYEEQHKNKARELIGDRAVPVCAVAGY
ncbi:hypothetical protein [Dyella acidisoli]|uniref:Uncharacterized protein n=1 Tax=Dyella acidisoli TaxID=1867834 RepID=A0ABQ5XIW2_9GAMM|nr:hypothetical protein [Dyella acidisoli]GLQ91645.1 hypothetical protein GCM10007901_05950 [Dyella acidisoli]